MTTLSEGSATTSDRPALPPADDAPKQLDSWAATLHFLDAEIAIGVEKLAKRLDLVMHSQQAPVVGTLEPNGYGGIARRGDLRRMLLSDWALSSVEPDEFMRRVANAELSYLQVERVEPQPPGGLAVLFDSGPEQAGAPRMAHLAALVVLERRARANGALLMVGDLGAVSPVWRTGALPELFEIWLRSRTARTPTREGVDRWVDGLEANSTLWVLGADGIDIERPEIHVERLYATESGWGPNGATTLGVTASDRTIELDLPDRATSLRIIRGRGVRRAASNAGDRVEGSLRFPSFNSAARKLLCRTDRDDELVSFAIPETREHPGGKPKRRKFRGRVIAASVLQSRTLAVVVDDDLVSVEVVGKKLGGVAGFSCERRKLELDDDRVDEICSTGLEPAFYVSGWIVFRIGGNWWRMNKREAWREKSFVDCIASTTLDQPLVVRVHGTTCWVGARTFTLGSQDQRVLPGPDKSYVTEVEPGEWLASDQSTISVDADANIVGLSRLKGRPALLEHSAGGQLIRLHQSIGSTTLTKISGDVESISLHPTRPIVATARSDRTILVHDLITHDRLHRIVGDAQ